MKRFAALTLALLLLGGTGALAVQDSAAVTVAAPAAVLMEKVTGTVLYAKGAVSYTHLTLPTSIVV